MRDEQSQDPGCQWPCCREQPYSCSCYGARGMSLPAAVSLCRKGGVVWSDLPANLLLSYPCRCTVTSVDRKKCLKLSGYNCLETCHKPCTCSHPRRLSQRQSHSYLLQPNHLPEVFMDTKQFFLQLPVDLVKCCNLGYKTHQCLKTE